MRALDEAIRLTLLEQAQLEIVSIEEIARFPATVGEVMEEEKEVSHLHHLQEEAVEKAIHAGLIPDNVSARIKIGHPTQR